jgi:hypothetical protein
VVVDLLTPALATIVQSPPQQGSAPIDLFLSLSLTLTDALEEVYHYLKTHKEEQYGLYQKVRLNLLKNDKIFPFLATLCQGNTLP